MAKTVTYQIGDIVQLKSGGPKMTVKENSAMVGGDLLCQWFSGSKLNHGYFDPETLQRVEDATSK
jgi:uncharacterized protein YodC (DUF2158 family)